MASSIVLGITGTLLIFLPEELAESLHLSPNIAIVFQVLGALYFGFAMSNWTAKHSILGGIYGRAILIGNLSHFFTGGLVILKYYSKNGSYIFLLIAMTYLLFAFLFGYLFKTHPKTA
ncbi:hypothetical protein HH304_09050 [Flammeovirgaceae bacterium KN852]|uniref:Uncharacterized protein n=1 Tax=Marinigracilibium pacificum TaxID=2729599 RepID=A0A848J240_9BACT|nr:hypothetical protein [Marinigracilibium pacificum]